MTRRAFQFYPGGWQGSRWVVFDQPEFFCADAPPKPACYVVYLNGALSYVGQTVDFKKRMACHGIDLCRYSEGYDTPWGQFDAVVVKARFATKMGDWAMRELRLIARLQPPMNCVGSTRRRPIA